jgi:hypothetical protein
MATGSVQILTDARVYAEGLDLSGNANQVGVTGNATMKDVTTFDSGGWEEARPGLLKGSINVDTYLDESLVGTTLAAGSSIVVATIVADDAEFSVGYGLPATVASAGHDMPLGDMYAQPLEFDSSGALFRGELLLPKAAQTSAGNGSSRQLGAVAAGEKAYANLHVFAVTGGSVTVTVESDDDTGFASGTTQLSFAAASAVGAESLSTDGTAITDDWWRVAWTQTASSATFAVVVGIQ